jgi:hypothetical protein
MGHIVDPYRAISWIDFFKASCKSAEVFGGEIHNTLILLLPKNLA